MGDLFLSIEGVDEITKITTLGENTVVGKIDLKWQGSEC